MAKQLEYLLGLKTDHVISYADNPNILAQKTALQAFKALQMDAKKQGFDLQICSGFRSFQRQVQIVEAKFNGTRAILDIFEQPLAKIPEDPIKRLQAILVFSALPGFSRHHLGSDFDIYAPNLLPQGQSLQLTYHEYLPGAYFYELGQYLQENLAKFDFTNPYNHSDYIFKCLGLNQDQQVQSSVNQSQSTQNNTQAELMGYEPWHISYPEAARPYLEAFDYQSMIDYVSKIDSAFAPYVKEAVSEQKAHSMLAI